MIDVVMPKMGESIVEGTILEWKKEVGDLIKKDEPILEISTDKVDSEVPAPATGILLEIIANVNDTILTRRYLNIGQFFIIPPSINLLGQTTSYP